MRARWQRALTALCVGVAAVALHADGRPAAAEASAIAPPRIVARFDDRPTAAENMVKPVTLIDGRVLALSIADAADGRQTLLGRYSRDGERFDAPVRLLDLPSREQGGFGYFTTLVDRAGEVHLFFLNDARSGIVLPRSPERPPLRSGPALDIWHVKSSARGAAWGAPKRIWTGRAGDPTNAIELASGRLLLPISYMTSRSWARRGTGAAAFTYIGSFSSSAIYSDDGGETWRQSADELVVPTAGLADIGGVEPVILQRKDRSIWMLIRTQRGRFYESVSVDDGASWTPPAPTGIVASESPAGLVRLRDGRLLMLWNECLRYPYAHGGRHALHGALSDDDGRTWRGHREVLRDAHRGEPAPPDSDWGIAYPFITLLPDGDVLFSAWVETGRSRALVRFDPRWLDETRQHADFSRGLDAWSTFGTRGVALQTDSAGPAVTAATTTPAAGSGEPVLAVRRADLQWPSGAVLNLPKSAAATLRVRVKLTQDFGGALLGLTDHFSVPWDAEDVFHNIFTLDLRPDGTLLGTALTRDRWHELRLDWQTAQGDALVSLDGAHVGRVPAARASTGVNYLRVRSTATRVDGGLLIASVTSEPRVEAAAPAGR